ncbi:MAG: NAD(P)/FAD-dependent oxidoreductase [Fervidicoccaceae archaeon]
MSSPPSSKALSRVAVVGAGPWGLLLAESLASSNCDVVVFEEHSRVGLPRHCAGIVSTRVFSSLGEPIECVEAEHRSLRVVTRLGGELRLRGSPLLVSLERVCLEEVLLERAERAGADVRLGVRVERFGEKGEVVVEGGVERFDHVVLAFGARSELSPLLWERVRSGLPGLNAVVELEEPPLDGSEVLVLVDHSIARGFFSWFAPLGGRRALVGLASESWRGGRRRLEAAVKAAVGAKVRSFLNLFGGVVLRGPPLRRLWAGRVTVVGDAGGLVKPLTGGGLYSASLVAERVKGASCEEALRELRLALSDEARRLRLSRPLAEIVHDPANEGLVDSIISALGSSGLPELLDFDEHERVLSLLARDLRLATRVALTLIARGSRLDNARRLLELALELASPSVPRPTVSRPSSSAKRHRPRA